MGNLFNIDTPASSTIDTPSRFSGWYIPSHQNQVRLNLYLNSKPYASLQHGSERRDVAAAFPEKDAINSGFSGDVLLPPNIISGEEIEVEIFDESNKRLSLFKDSFIVSKTTEQLSREKNFKLEDIVCLPEGLIYEDLKKNQDFSLQNHNVYLRGNSVHILNKNELPILKVSQNETTHPYPPDVVDLLSSMTNGLVLDLGAGNTPVDLLSPNVCYLDVHQYRYTDVVCTASHLPFLTSSFDAVISQAVFEHIPNPFTTAEEVYRILKPGGIVHIETAFMQPLHADPSHYFNMTIQALRLVMSKFEEIQSGIKPYQFPSFGLRMQLEAVLPHMNNGKWKLRLEDLYQLLIKEGNSLDDELGSRGRTTLAAGVFFRGRKPV